MEKRNYFREMLAIYERLQDEESKRVFEIRIAYILNRNMDNYVGALLDYYHDWRPLEIDERRIEDQEVILFGCGHDGRQACRLLMSGGGVKVAYYCDNYQCGRIIGGIKVLSVDEVVKEHRDAFVIIASSKFGESMYIQLAQRGFPYHNILLPKHKEVIGVRGEQYFDVFEPRTDEIYIDAGTFDGETVLKFCEWTKGNYRKIYAFEPTKNMCEVISEKMEKAGIKNTEILNSAVWDRKETLHFFDNGPASKINSDGDMVVQGVNIDSVVSGEKVTFIKMDVEGCELKALEGAEQTIRVNKPRLAICIYHRLMDVFDIASYLLKVVPEYKFYVRQYWSTLGEAVLYAEATE